MEQMTRIQSMGADPVQWGTQTWTLAYAHTNWNARMPEERMTVVHQDNGHLRILNETSLDLRECLVVFNGEYWTIGAIPKGASYDEPWASDKGGRHGSFYQHYERSDPENWVREVMPFYSLENRGSWDTRLQPLVVCLSDTSLEPLVVHGLSPKEETLNLIRIPFIVNSNSLEEQ